MAITPFEKDIEIIQKLDDEPNDVQGLTPEELKKRFDQAAIWLKEYINGTLIPAITGDGGTGGASNIGAAVDDFPGETVQEVLDAFNDALTDRYTKSETNSYVGQETENLVETVHVDLTTGVITVTKKDGSKETFDTALEKVPATMALVDEESGTYLVITNVDGSQTKTDVSKLIDTYTFQNSAEVAFSVDGSGNNKTVTASIRPASIGLDRFTLEVTQKLEQYNATSKANADAAAASAQAAKASETNAKGSETAASGSASQSAQSAGAASGSASQAAQSAGAAAASAESAQSNAAQALAAKNAAEASATLSQSWTEGGTGIREGENTNNAKYWAGVAQGAAGGGVTTFNGRSGAVVPAKGDYTAKMVGAVAEPNGGKAGQVLTKTEDGTEWGDAPNAENAVTVPGGGTMQMGESLGDGPYTIEVTEDGEGGNLSAEQVGYNNEGTGITATNVQDAVTELFTSVSEGKAAIAAAITDKGVATAADATFQQMAEKIGEIQSTPEYELVEVSTSGANTQFITLKDGALLATFDRDSTVQIVKGTIFTFAYNISSPSITGDLKNLGVDTRGYPMIKVNGAGSIKIGGGGSN